LQLACKKFGVVTAMPLDMIGNFGRHDEAAL
jgi:predicted outer membrane lipoprotein